jgi:phage shock protein PspC (stress-responsive transcriptional regulator)
MKKTISININGQVFNIEEDGYEKLRNYLVAITKYFSNYSDSKEILTDIEGRISEKFLENLKKEEKQAISSQDVESLIKSMGTVEDFEAIKEDEDLFETEANLGQNINSDPKAIFEQNTKSQSNTASTEQILPKKLYRDSQRKLIGGVCAGIAHYFGVDPIWVRLLFLGCLGFIPLLAAFSAIIVVVYIACWIAFPANNELQEDENIKKFFRDPDKKVLAGVVAGISKYTGVDLGLLRLIFVLSILLAGTGLMVYLILWAITPFAKTLTDKMQMKGEPITLENIDSNIKNAKNINGNSESAIATVLLFPFRIIGKILSATGPLFQFLLMGIRIFAGLLLVIIGGSALIGLVTALFSSWGAFGDLPIGVIDNVPLHLFAIDAPKSMFFFLFFAIAVPFLALALVGISIIGKKNQFNAVILQTLGGLWLMGILGSSFTASKYATNFKKNGKVEKTVSFDTGLKTPVLDISDNEGWDNYKDVRFYIEANSTNKIELNEIFEARGATIEAAQKNAQLVNHKIDQKDSVLIFDRVVDFANNAPFRFQELKSTITLPKDRTFVITRQFAGHLNNFDLDWDTIDWDIKTNRIKGEEAARFKFDTNGDLKCIDLKPIEKEDQADENGQYSKEYSFNNFSNLEFYGDINVEIVEGPNSKITVKADDQNDFNEFRFDQDGRKIVAHFHENDSNENNSPINIKIEAPKYSTIVLTDKANLKISNSTQKDFKIKLSNQSKIEITGKASNLDLEVHDNAEFNGDDFEVENVKISSYNQSQAILKVVTNIKAEAFDQSKIEYIGNPKNVQLSPNGESEISKKSEN